MKAMILAAGLGTRLRPLTDDRPKALVEVAERTLVEIALTRLGSFGIRDVIINVHHFADQIVDYLKAHKNFGMRIEISREDVLLDSGGGLKKAGWFFLESSTAADEPFILHNVDVLSAMDLRRMVEVHIQKKALATLAVQQRDSSRVLLFDENLRLAGRRAGRDLEPEIVCPSANLRPLAFCGVHVISPRFLRMMQEDGVFSIIDSYLQLASRVENILGFPADEYYWRDVGKFEQVQQADEDYKQGLFS
jgi:NDP-sugar pyrophosphorylase family protein